MTIKLGDEVHFVQRDVKYSDDNYENFGYSLIKDVKFYVSSGTVISIHNDTALVSSGWFFKSEVRKNISELYLNKNEAVHILNIIGNMEMVQAEFLKKTELKVVPGKN